MNTPENNQPALGAAGDELPAGAQAPAAEAAAPVAAPQEEKEQESKVNWNPERTAAENTQQDFEIFSALDREYDPKRDVLMHLPSDDLDTVQAALDARPNVAIDQTREGAEWLATIQNAELARPYRNSFKKTVRRKGARFTQGVPSEKGRLNAGNMSFKDQGGAKLTGERAVLRVRALTGMGSVIRVPLWHSGFWIALKAPTEGSLLELHRRLADDKITLGRSTYGMALANMSVHYAGTLMDFALSHVYDSSLHPSIENTLRSRIDALDIPLIVWAMACTIYPGGFPYARAVLHPEKGEKTIREKINVGRLLWTDNSALTEWQIKHMSNYHGQTMTEEAITRYKNEFASGVSRKVQLTEQVSVTLRRCNIDTYLNSGNKWISGIIQLVDEAFARPTNDEVRNAYIMDQGKATMMRQYGHLVESINIGTGDTDDEMISDADTIDETLNVLSANTDIRKAFFEGVQGFLEDATMAIIAVPTTEDEDRSTLPRFPHLLPIDVLSVFFILLVQKIPQIQER